MGSKFRIRKIFKPLVSSLARVFSFIGLTPNTATILMLVFALTSSIFLIFFKSFLWFGIMVFLTGIFDGIDGAIARLNNRETKFGGFFDSVMDRLSEFVIFISLLIDRWNQILWFIIDMRVIIFLSFFASIMISYSRSRAETFHSGDYDIGLMARSERLFFIFIISVISVFIGFLNELLFIFLFLVLLTAFYRAISIHKILKKKKNNQREGQ